MRILIRGDGDGQAKRIFIRGRWGWVMRRGPILTRIGSKRGAGFCTTGIPTG